MTHLFIYLLQKFLLSFFFFLLVALFLVWLLDTLELLRRASKQDVVVPLEAILTLGILKLPRVGQLLVPLVILFASMFTFWSLTRSYELIVMRTVGISFWQFVQPFLFAAFVLGALRVGVVQPFSTLVLQKYRSLEQHYLNVNRKPEVFSRTGFWFRQKTPEHIYFIRAQTISLETQTLHEVTLLQFDHDHQYLGRMTSSTVFLGEGFWRIKQGVWRVEDKTPRPVENVTIPTAWTFQHLQKSFLSVEETSFWTLPESIETLDHAGLSSFEHRLQYQELLLQPFLYCTMVLLAAIFCLRLPRLGYTFLLITSGLFVGLFVFFMTRFLSKLALNSVVPLYVTVWVPLGIVLLVSFNLLLRLEE